MVYKVPLNLCESIVTFRSESHLVSLSFKLCLFAFQNLKVFLKFYEIKKDKNVCQLSFLEHCS